MEALIWTTVVVVILLVGVNIYTSRMRQRYREVVKTSYEWLSIMSLAEWKTTIKLRDDLGLRQRLSQEQIDDLPLILIYTDLNQLVREALIEEKYQLKEYVSGNVTLRVYRLTPKGLQKAKENTSIEQGEAGSLDLQPI